MKIKEKKSKRISPYLESEIWDKDDFQTIIKYELLKRNKAALSLLWDLDARPHEISGLKIKHIKLKEKYDYMVKEIILKAPSLDRLTPVK